MAGNPFDAVAGMVRPGAGMHSRNRDFTNARRKIRCYAIYFNANDLMPPHPPQSPDPSSRLAQKLIAMAQVWRREIARALAELGISDALALPLIHLRRDGDAITQRCLAARVGVDNSSLVRVLDALEQSGDIQRVADVSDRRAKLIHMTAQGQQTADRIETILQHIRRHYLAGVDPLDLQAMDRVLDAMLAAHASLATAPDPQD